LIGKADVGREARQVRLSVPEAFEGRPCSQSHAVTGDRLASQRVEDSTEVMRRDREHPRQVHQGVARLRGQRLTHAVDQRAPSPLGCRSPGVNTRIMRGFESLSGEPDQAFHELVLVVSAPGGGKQQSMVEVDRRRRGQGCRGQRGLAAPDGRQ
jgi:hypothetical protein